jgi:hypothetical protein
MANTRYAYANERMLTGQIDWLTDTIKVVLVSTSDYVVLPDTHRHLSDVPIPARVAISDALTSKTAASGVARATDLTINSVSGPVVDALILFHDTGNEGTSELICYLDTGVGLPWDPQGQDVVIHWDTGPNGIFKL